MAIKIQNSFLPHTNADESLAFYRDVLGFELRNDVGYGDMRWLTLASADQSDTAVVLTPPAVDPGITDDERRVILELIAKGSFASLILATDDIAAVFEKVEASGADILQEPLDQDWGVRDCAFRDPAGNTIRLQQIA